MEIENRTIALLIDADNVSNAYFNLLLEELNKFGNVTYKRIYGDFTTTQFAGWKAMLQSHGITPIQQFAYTKGKNATDAAMIIDAMDIMYKGRVNCICLATSDSDFTKLANRFKEENYLVLGAGETKTPAPFRNACDRFFLMDVLLKETKEETAKKKVSLKSDKFLLELIVTVQTIIGENADDQGWAHFSGVMIDLYKKMNTFNPRNYGSNKRPIDFFRDLPGQPFELRYDQKVQFIRISGKKSTK